MSKTDVTKLISNNQNTNHLFENASTIAASLPYKKYLPEATPETHRQFLQASGSVDYTPTNNYIFQALFQEDMEALTNLICSILHWPREKIKSIEITNPIVLGKYIDSKTFILDIKVLLNDDTVVNLEMQLNNYKNWPERSLGYLCRNFDNLNKGDDYINTKAAIHIGFLDFTLFANQPEFHATYKIQNIKNHNIYTDKFILHVIELNSIHLATEEDHNYEIDTWASLFKAKTWEDIHMLINDNPTLQSAAETLYQINMDEQLREACERFIRAEAEQNALYRINAELTQSNAELTQSNAELTQSNAELTKTNVKLNQTLTAKNVELMKKDAKIAELTAILAARDNTNK